MPGAENSQANAQVLMTAYNNFNNQLKTATDDEKMQLAKFIAANPDIFSPFEDISIYKDSLSLYKITASSTTPEIKLSDFDAGVKIRVTKLLISSVVTIALGASTGGIAFAACAIITIRCMYDLDDYCIINLAEIVDRIGSFSLTASKGTSSNNFTKGRQYSIYVRSDYRNLYSADISSNSTVISSIVSGLNSLHNIWDKINSYLPVTVLGATIVPKLNGESVDLSKVTTYGQKNEPVSTAFLSLQDISNSNVTATVDNSGSVLKVTFNTTATTNQDFTYNVVYTNPDADNYSQSFSGTVIVNTGHTIGESFGGGIVAYILQSGDPGYNASVQHGLIAAPSDQSTGIGWGCDSTTSSATGTAIGTGLSNTNIIVFMCGVGTAASICKNYTGGGYNDWYLPSIYELETLYNNKTTIGGFASAYYWSSSEGGMDASYGQNFANGATIYIYKYSTYSVRAIRTF